MRVVTIADLHGHLPETPEGDLLLIAGDLCPLTDHRLDFQADWLITEFSPWLQRQPATEKVFIAGNHDFVCQLDGFAIEADKFGGHYLQDSGIELLGLNLWGSPWTPGFGEWAFQTFPDQARELAAAIPSDVDIIISHGPISGVLDEVSPGRHVGCPALGSRVQRLAPPLVVSGHIHECSGRIETIGATTFVNPGIMDDHFQPTKGPIVIDLENTNDRWQMPAAVQADQVG